MIHRFDTVDSTNEIAKSDTFRNAEHGTVIVAESQTAGKGRFGKSFYSPKGGIYMSVILASEAAKADKASKLITLFAAVCVCEAIEIITDKKPQIKWVNDIFVDGKKICGILTESSTDRPNRAIVGIGINLFGASENFPEELQGIAGALFEEFDESDKFSDFNKETLIAEITNRLIQKRSRQEIISQYKSRLTADCLNNIEEINEQIEKFCNICNHS